MEQWLPLMCSSTPVCLGAVLSAHSCSPFITPTGDVPLISRLRAEARARRLSSPPPDPFPVRVSHRFLFAIRLPYRRVPTYPPASAALYPPPSCLLRLCGPLPSLSSSSSRSSFCISAQLPSPRAQTPFVPLSHRMLSFSFIPIHIADPLFPISSFSCLASSVSSLLLFRLSLVSHLVSLTFYASFSRTHVLIRLRVMISIPYRSLCRTPLSFSSSLSRFILRT